ncbi:MAG TPA: two-component regulator propeller domain-containing protein [Blastocatellia bacterium]|nr:two-component regulator propeller domain-containing protein [Blastocatellia bacterium]
MARIKARRIFSLVGWTLGATLTLAGIIKAERLLVKAYTTANGLAQNTVNRIVRDSRGFLWFCTEDGLSRYDGYTFTNYGVEQGLPDNQVRDLLETITYEMRENFTASARQAMSTVAGQVFTLVQAAGGGVDNCSYTLTPTRDVFTAKGGNSTINVACGAGCGWRVVSNQSWATFPASNVGLGNGAVTYTVAAKRSTNGRAATITIGNQSFAIKQKGR